MDEIESLTSRLKALEACKHEFKQYLLSKAERVTSVNRFVEQIYQVTNPYRILVHSPQSMRKKFPTELELARKVIKIVINQWAVKELLDALLASSNEHLFADISEWLQQQEKAEGSDSGRIVEDLKLLDAHKEEFKGILCQKAGELEQVDTFVNHFYNCTPRVLEYDYEEMSKSYRYDKILAEKVIKIAVNQWAMKELIEALEKSCNIRQFSSPIADWIKSKTAQGNELNSLQASSSSGVLTRQPDDEDPESLPHEGICHSDSQASQGLPCCGHSIQELANNPGVLCRHVLKTSKSLQTDEWENFDRHEAMNSNDDGFKFRDKDVKLRALLDVCSIFGTRLRHLELENVTLKNLKKGRSPWKNIFHRVNYPELQIVYLSIKDDNQNRSGKTLKKEWIRSLLFFVPGKHKWNNIWNVNAAPKLAQVFLEVDGIVYIHMKKAAVGNALVLSEWRKLNADEYLKSTEESLNYFHCLGRTISVDLLSSCKGLKELNLHNCYFPTTVESDLSADEASKIVAHSLCATLCKLPKLSKIIFDARRFKNSCFDLSLISKWDQQRAALQLTLGHTKIIWDSSNGDLKNSIAECNFSKILLYKCQIEEVRCICEEFRTLQTTTTEPEKGIIEIEKQNTTATIKFHNLQLMDNTSDASCQISPNLRTDYYHLFQLYNFYTRKYWESKLGPNGKKMNGGSTSLIILSSIENDDDQLRLLDCITL